MFPVNCLLSVWGVFWLQACWVNRAAEQCCSDMLCVVPKSFLWSFVARDEMAKGCFSSSFDGYAKTLWLLPVNCWQGKNRDRETDTRRERERERERGRQRNSSLSGDYFLEAFSLSLCLCIYVWLVAQFVLHLVSMRKISRGPVWVMTRNSLPWPQNESWNKQEMSHVIYPVTRTCLYLYRFTCSGGRGRESGVVWITNAGLGWDHFH